MKGVLVARDMLSEEQRGRMLELLRANFENVTQEQFMRDLGEKNWVILIVDEGERVVGFSTLLLYRAIFEGREIAVVYSGDTIIEQEAWGSPALPRTWIESVWRVHGSEFPGLPLYWLLITSGYRTYRFLSVFWREFYPNYAGATPAGIQRMIDALARERFGGRYERVEGLAGVAHLGQPLRGELLELPESKMKDPHVAFFARNNPGYVRGDELVCVAELTEGNLTAAGRRMVAPARVAVAGV